MDLEDFIARKIAHSRAAFGPHQTPAGILDHLKKEVAEVELAISKGKILDEIPEEFVDCFMLSLDGIWRAIAASIENAESPAWTDDIAMITAKKLRDKLNINEAREWPDYSKLSPDVAREHIRDYQNERNEASYNNTMPLNLIVNGYYKDRIGREHGPMLVSPGVKNGFFSRDYPTVVWDMYGKRLGQEAKSDFDLVEYVGQVPSWIPLNDLSG